MKVLAVDSTMNIKELREQLQLSQEGLARKIGVSWCTVSRWERGHVKPSPLAKEKLARLEAKIACLK